MKNQNSKYIFVLNPNAGNGKTKREWPKIKEILQEKKISGKIITTKSHKQGIDIAKEYADNGYENIIAIGGDGTLNEIVNGVMQSKNHKNVTIGLIPLGSGNDFARGIGLEFDLNMNIERIRSNQVTKFDLGKLENKFFINSLGIGFDACVAANANKIKKLKGIFKYLLAVFYSFGELRPLTVDITIRNFTITKNILLISVGNSNLTGGGFRITPNAVPTDNLFDISIIDYLPKFKIMYLLPKAIKGKHMNHKAVSAIQSDHILIESKSQLPIYMDGEIPTFDNPKRLEIKILPSAIKFFF